MQSTAKKSDAVAVETAERRTPSGARKAKVPVYLVTGDDSLWPEIGPHLSGELVLKQVDSVDELLTTVPPGQPAIVLWDARHQSGGAGVLSRLQLHSARFAVIALDGAGGAHTWANPIALRQVIAQVLVPILPQSLKAALDSAYEEVNARSALLGSGHSAAGATAADDTASAPPLGARRFPWIPAGIIAAVIIAFVTAFFVLRETDAPKTAPSATPSPTPDANPTPGANPTPDANPIPAPRGPGTANEAAEEKVDLLIEKAQQAMQERHFIEPADGSALALYRRALALDPDNGEARQGLARLAEVLVARVQSALDERKIDVALQALETARSIDAGDGRLAALDERIASLRAEFGPAQILAAINAQNFDRAAQLIDDAARSKSLSAAKLAQLRDELRRRRGEVDIANLLKLADLRMQQDKLTEPRNDSAAFYFAAARAAGAPLGALQPVSQEFTRRVVQALHSAIEQRRLADADRLLADLRAAGAPNAASAGLQREINAARAPTAAAPEQPPLLDLAQARLAQGKVTEPDDDSALYYVNQLRAADPKNSGLAGITGAVQAQILDRARVALDSGQPAQAASLLDLAAGLGPSFDLAALKQRLGQVKQASGDMPEITEASLTRVRSVEVDYPPDALRKNIEGWVELSYVVTAEGKVTAIKVLESNPRGLFEAAAIHALSRVRYKPMLQSGKPTPVSTKLRIAFRVGK